jgi:hypothetical protein
MEEPYENFQILIRADMFKCRGQTARTQPWWIFHHIAEYSVPLFRLALFVKIFLRPCVSTGNYYQTSRKIFRSAIDEAAEFIECEFGVSTTFCFAACLSSQTKLCIWS